MGEALIFYFFASILIMAALMMITVRNPVQAAFYLVLSFFTSAVIWLLLEAEFLAIVLVLVYVGAVMVLFLFVVMMLDINIVTTKAGFTRYFPIGIVVAAVLFACMFYMVGYDVGGILQLENPVAALSHDEGYSNTNALGSVLYQDYVYAVEIAAVILLVAIIAAITLTHRRRTDVKRQNPDKQVQVKRNDRLRILKMPSEGES
jgi:NADH-quinone oxidoreductase subunit J